MVEVPMITVIAQETKTDAMTMVETITICQQQGDL